MNWRMTARAAAVFAAICVCASAAHAITWADDEVDDPFSDGTCKVHVPMSYGGYIYSYPSKWNGVFWPFTDPMWVWACPSGFVAFGSDVAFSTEEEMGTEERSRIESVLPALAELADNDAARWNRLIELEPLRERTLADQSHFARLMVNQAETPEEATRLRPGAVAVTKAALAEIQDPHELALLKFVLGVYSELDGDRAAADVWFAEARATKWTDDNGAEQTGMPYLEELILEVEARRTESPE